MSAARRRFAVGKPNGARPKDKVMWAAQAAA